MRLYQSSRTQDQSQKDVHATYDTRRFVDRKSYYSTAILRL